MTASSSLPIEVFKTSVNTRKAALRLALELQSFFPNASIHFDLEDCDKVLRIAPCIHPEIAIKYLNENGFTCEVLL